jgi:hypothetical protein
MASQPASARSGPPGFRLAAAVPKRPEAGPYLIPGLSNDLVLSILLARFVDEDSLFLVMAQLNCLWAKELDANSSSTLLWRELCLQRAWVHLARQGFPLPGASATDWGLRLMRRPRLRMGGAYWSWQVFIQYSGPRTMWTPKDAKPVELIYHYRFFWFTNDGRLAFAAVSTDHPDNVLGQVKAVRENMGAHAPDSERVWVGTYQLFRGDKSDPGVFAHVSVPMRRHEVRFRVQLGEGGSQARIVGHVSFRFSEPESVSNHLLPGDYRRMFYKPGYL